MSHLGVGVVIAAVSGCVSTPTFTGVGIVPDGNGLTISAPSYALHFSSTGFHFPDSLKIEGTETLAIRQTCDTEEGVGIAVFPGFVASPTSLSNPGTGGNSVIPKRNGPAAAQVDVAWSVDFSCGTGSNADGVSTFTAFPDGRIVRRDRVNPTDKMLNGTVGCGCMEQNTEYFVTSFITFSNDAFSALTTTPEAPFPAIATDAGPSIGPTACLDGKGPRVALSWDMQTRTRAPFSGASTFVYDFTGSTPTIDAGDLPTKTMALMVDRGDRDCTSLLNVLLTQNMLLVANAMVANDQDGIYTDPNPHDPNDGPISITSQSPLIPPGFAVTLDFGGASDLAISATSAFLYQHDPDGRFTIWFRDALTTDTITVTPK